MSESGEQAQDWAGTKSRSPNYPAIPLDEAISRARTLYEKEKRNAVPLEVAMKDVGYAVNSGPAKATMAALGHFGLTEAEGSRERRKVRLSELGWRIIGDKRESSPERDEAIKKSALSPTIHAELWNHSELRGASDDAVEYYLTFERKPPFTPNGAKLLIKEYRRTLEVAQLDETTILSAGVEDNSAGDGSPQGNIPPPSQCGEQPGQRERIAQRLPMQAAQSQNTLPSKQFSFDVTEGQCFVQVPAPLSEESIEVFEGWLELIKKQVQRLKAKPAEGEES